MSEARQAWREELRARFAKTGPSGEFRLASNDLIAAMHLSSTSSSTHDSFISLKNTAKMSDDEERVTMPFKFVTGELTTCQL